MAQIMRHLIVFVMEVKMPLSLICDNYQLSRQSILMLMVMELFQWNPRRQTGFGLKQELESMETTEELFVTVMCSEFSNIG